MLDLHIQARTNNFNGIDNYACFVTRKTSLNSKTRRKSERLKLRLHHWKNGQIDQLTLKVKQFERDYKALNKKKVVIASA